MASNNPVPSRAAIHALRGLVFGTSCSVVLIAEERRRRLKTVRSAAENARKIHAAKTHRGLTSSDGHLAWEARLLHRNEENLASVGDSPSPRNFRRTEPDKRRIRKGNNTLDESTAAADPTIAGRTSQAGHAAAQVPKDGNASLLSQDAVSRAAGDGLSAWVNRLAGVDSTPMTLATSIARTGATSILKDSGPSSVLPSSSDIERSEIQRKLAASRREASMSNISSSANTRDPAPQRATDTALAGVDSTRKPSKTSISHMAGIAMSKIDTVKQPQPALDAEVVAAGGDGMAKWEAAIGRPTVPGPRRRPHVPKYIVPMDPSTLDMESLAQEGDGLARWDVHINALPPDMPRGSESPIPKPRFKPPFRPDKNGQLQPTFELSEIGAVALSLIDRLQNSGLGPPREQRFLQSCLLLERLLSMQRERDDTNLATHVHSLMNALVVLREVAPETLRHRPYEVSLMFLQRTAREQPAKLQDHIMLFPMHVMTDSEILRDLVRWMVRGRHTEALRQLLHVLQQDVMSSLWRQGLFLSSLLQIPASPPLSARDLFVSLQDAGLSEDTLPPSVLTDCRNRIISVDAVLGQDTFALAILQTMEGKSLSNIDFPVARALLVRDVRRSSAAEVLGIIKEVMRTSEGTSWLHSWRSQLVSLFVASHDTLENEALLRGMLTTERFPLEPSWVLRPLEHYSDTGNLDKFLDWLRFSVRNGFRFDTSSTSKLTSLLSKRWSVPSPNASKILSDVEPFLIRVNGIGGTDAVATEKDPNTEAVEDQVFKEMVNQIRDSNWDVAVTIYAKYLATGLPFSSRCLGLAVTAGLNRDGPLSETAKRFIREGQDQGQDVTNELRRLLVASFPSVSSPSVRLALASEQGLDTSPDLYNIVARECIARREYKEALQICEQSAAEHGERKLGYDEMNFSNLLQIYMALRTRSACAALGHLVSDFVSQPQWWHRSSICKEALKYQLKRLKGRPIHDRILHQAVVAALDTALQHVAKQRAEAGNPDWIAAEVTAILCSDANAAEQSRQHLIEPSTKIIPLGVKKQKTTEPQPASLGHDLEPDRLTWDVPEPKPSREGLNVTIRASSEQKWDALEEQIKKARVGKPVHKAAPRDDTPAEWGSFSGQAPDRGLSKDAKTMTEEGLAARAAVPTTA